MPYLDSRVLFTNYPYTVVIDQSCLSQVDEELFVIANVTPAPHAASHGASGSDPVTLAISQVTGLQSALDGKIDESLATAADQGLYSTAPSTWSVFSLQSWARSLLGSLKANWNESLGIFKAYAIEVDTAPAAIPPGSPGRMIWNDTTGTIEFQLKGGNVTLEIGQEQIIRVKNDEGSPLAVGDVVYLSGANGIHALVKKASALNDQLSAYTIGMVVEAMSNNGQGWVAISGYVHDINTNHLTEGAPVWLSTVAGQTTSTKPTPPNHSVFLGMCVRKNTNVGSILLAIQNGYELDELHDVLITSPTTGQTIIWDNVLKVWKNVTLTAADVSAIPSSYLDTDGTLAANSDLRVATQKATKTYADTKVSKSGDTMTGALIVNATGSTVGTGTLAQALVVNAGGPTGAAFTSNDIMVMKADRFPYFQFINNTSGGTVNDGFKIGIEDTYALIAVKEAWDLRFWTNNLLRLTIAATGELTVAKGTTFQADIAVQGTGSTIGSGALANQLVINGGGPAITSADLFVIKAAGYPYMQFVNNNSGGTVNDGFKIGLENTYALFAMKENWDIRFWTNNTDRMRIQNDGKVAIGSFAPTAMLHIQAGTATANTAPLKFTSGTLMTTPEAGAIEYDGTNLYYTASTTRETLNNKVSKAGDTMTGPLTISLPGDANTFRQVSGNGHVLIGTATDITAYGGAKLQVRESGSSVSDWKGRIVCGGDNAVFLMGEYLSNAWLGAHNSSLTAWANMYIQPSISANIWTYIGTYGVWNNNIIRVKNLVGVGVGIDPTAYLHLKAGTATANTAPLKFTSGTLMTTPEAGAVEFLTDKAYLTITTGAARKELALADTALTSGQSPTITTNGRLTNSNKFDIYATGTTNGAAGSAVNLTIATLPTSGDLRFARITVKAKSAAAMPDIFGRTLDAMWGNGMGTLTQVGTDQLGTALTVGNLAAATIATSASGTTLRVTCTDVTGCGATVTWEAFG